MNTLLPYHDKLYAGTYWRGIYYLEKGYNQWQRLGNGLSFQNILSIHIRDSVFLAGTQDSGLFYSGNNGKSWQKVTNGFTGKTVTCIRSHDGYLYAGTLESGIFRSIDSGQTWSSYNLNIVSKKIIDFVFIDSTIIVGTEGEGVLHKTKFAGEWSNISFGLENLSLSILYLSDNYIYAGLQGSGLFRLPRIGFETSLKPTHYADKALSIYPNPNKGKFSIDSETEIDYVELRDIHGRRVYSQTPDVAARSIEIEVQNQESGIYFIIVYQDGQRRAETIIFQGE